MGTSLERLVNATRLKAGPFRYSTSLQLANAGYDSDIYFGSRPIPVPDYGFSIGTSLRLFLPLKKKIVFDISESPQYRFFLKTKRDRALDNAFDGRVHFVFDRFYVQVGGGLLNVKQRLNTEFNLNIRLKEDSINGLILWQASKGTSFALQYQRLIYRFENVTSETVNVSENLNRSESYLDLTAYFLERVKTRFYLNCEYGSYIFTETASNFKNSRTYSFYGGIEFLPPAAGYTSQTAGIRGRINIGYQIMDFLDPLQKDFSGLSGNTEVSLGIMKLTALHLFVAKGPQFSIYSDRAYYIQTSYGSGVSHSFTPKILFTYDFSYSRNAYPMDESAGGVSSGKYADRYSAHSFRLNFRLRKDLGLSLLANLARRNSKLAPQPVSKRYFIGFSLTYGHTSGGLALSGGPIS